MWINLAWNEGAGGQPNEAFDHTDGPGSSAAEVREVGLIITAPACNDRIRKC